MGTVAVDVMTERGVSRLYEDTIPAALLRSSRLDGYTLGSGAAAPGGGAPARRSRRDGGEPLLEAAQGVFRGERGLGITREI